MEFSTNRFAGLEFEPAEPEKKKPEPTVARLETDQTVKVGGAAGWYAGDMVATTSGKTHDAGQEVDGPGIEATADETAIERACKLFGMPTYSTERVYRKTPAGDLVEVVGANLVVSDRVGTVSTKTVSDGYQLLQPHEAFGWVEPLLSGSEQVDLGDGEAFAIDRGGTMKNDSLAWLQSRPVTMETPSGPATTRLYLQTGMAGNASTRCAQNATVAICRNYIRSILGQGSIAIKHTKSARARLERLKAFLQAFPERREQAQQAFFGMAQRKLTTGDLDAFLESVFHPGVAWADVATETKNNVGKFLEGYKTAPGASPGNAWGLHQASTYYSTHIQRVRSGTDPWASQNEAGGASAKFQDRALQTVSVLMTA